VSQISETTKCTKNTNLEKEREIEREKIKVKERKPNS